MSKKEIIGHLTDGTHKIFRPESRNILKFLDSYVPNKTAYVPEKVRKQLYKEGNTYSRLDTQKLVEEGITAEGKVHEETVMIMNHKEAILFLVENAQDIELNSLTIRNLHHLLSQTLGLAAISGLLK